MDFSTWHDQKPAHEPVSAEETELRRKLDQAFLDYEDYMEKRWQLLNSGAVSDAEDGNTRADLNAGIDQAEKALQVFLSLKHAAPLHISELRQASSHPDYRDLK